MRPKTETDRAIEILFGRSVETAAHSAALKPVREAAMRLAAHYAVIARAPGTGEPMTNALQYLRMSLTWAELTVTKADAMNGDHDQAQAQAEREALFERIAGSGVIGEKQTKQLASFLGLELELPPDEADGEDEDDGSEKKEGGPVTGGEG